MRILIFIIWLALGIIYFFIWSQRSDCCSNQSTTAIESTLPPVINDSRANLNVEKSEAINGENKSSSLSVPATSTFDSASMVKNQLVLGSECLKFEWADAEPISANCFISQKDSVIKSMQPGQILEVMGYYFEKENRVMASGDLGLIRALKIKNLIVPAIPADNIKLRSKNLGDSTGRMAVPVNLITYRSVFNNDQVKELDDKTMIYFKFASNAGVNDVLVNQYVNHLAQYLKTNQEQIVITGHTDDDATAEHNLTLGLRRANIIKNLLINKGVKASRIKTNSRGEEQPIAPNDTEENRKLNRRVEVIILPASKQN